MEFRGHLLGPCWSWCPRTREPNAQEGSCEKGFWIHPCLMPSFTYRLPLGPVALNSHPGLTEGPRASPEPKMPSQTVGSPRKTRPPAPLSESTPSPAGRGQRGAMTTEVDGAVSRMKGQYGKWGGGRECALLP